MHLPPRYRPHILVLLVAVLVALVAVGVQAATQRQSPAAADSRPRFYPRTPASDDYTVTVKTSEFAFTPNRLEVPAGSPVTIVLDNSAGAVEHDLDVPGLSSMHIHTLAGQVARVGVEIEPFVAGTFDFNCTIPGHKEAGMRGTLVVTPATSPAAGAAAGGSAQPTATPPGGH